MVDRIHPKRRIMRKLRIDELSSVDRPAQAHARMTLMKRADDDEPMTVAEKQQLDDLQKAVDELVDKVQARVPAGSSAGGQFASGGGAGGGSSGESGGAEAEAFHDLWTLTRSNIKHVASEAKQAGISRRIIDQAVKDKDPGGLAHIVIRSQYGDAAYSSARRKLFAITKNLNKDYCGDPVSIAYDVRALDFDAVLAEDEAIKETYQVQEEVRRSWAALQRSFATIASDVDVAPAAKMPAMRASLDQFIASLAEEIREDVVEKCLSAVPALAGLLEKSEEGDEVMTAAEKQQLVELQKTVKDLTKMLDAATATDQTKKTAELAGELETANAEAAELTKKLGAAEAASAEALAKAGMSDAEKEHMSGMDDKARKEWAALSSEDRKKKMKKVAEDDPVVYKAADGTEFRKSAGDAVLALAKRADESDKRAAEETHKREDTEYAKRADDELKPFAESVAKRDDKIEVLRAIDKMEDGPKAAILKMLEVGGKAIGAAFQTIGSRSETVVKSSQAFTKRVDEIQARDKCARHAAMTKARSEYPAEFEASQEAGAAN